jgi:anti-sigma factor RsiW
MRCRKWAVEISKWHEGELSDARQAELLRHLEGCCHCHKLEAQMRVVSAALSESPELPVPDFLSQKITASVSEKMRQHAGSSVSGLIGFLSYRYGALVVAAMLLIGLCIGGLAGRDIAEFVKVDRAKPSYDLLTLGGIGAEGQSVAFNRIWQGNAKGGRL